MAGSRAPASTMCCANRSNLPNFVGAWRACFPRPLAATPDRGCAVSECGRSHCRWKNGPALEQHAHCDPVFAVALRNPAGLHHELTDAAVDRVTMIGVAPAI